MPAQAWYDEKTNLIHCLITCEQSSAACEWWDVREMTAHPTEYGMEKTGKSLLRLTRRWWERDLGTRDGDKYYCKNHSAGETDD